MVMKGKIFMRWGSTVVYIRLIMMMIMLAKNRISCNSEIYARGSRSPGASFLRARRVTYTALRMRLHVTISLRSEHQDVELELKWDCVVEMNYHIARVEMKSSRSR